MCMHNVQAHILEVLARKRVARFRDMRPAHIDTNLYSYHLKSLQKEKYVEKTEGGYTLSPVGLSYVDGLSFYTGKLRKQPKIISILALRDSSGRWLVARRKYQPYIGKSMLVSGKQHFGEAPETHVNRELLEKLNLKTSLMRRGLADIRISREGVLITHVSAHVYSGELADSHLPTSTHQFDYLWYDPRDADTFLLAGTRQLMGTLQKSNNLFFLSLDVSDD
jgi:ADP-ribose pyrophosphatase YjhB (NUDIX family)